MYWFLNTDLDHHGNNSNICMTEAGMAFCSEKAWQALAQMNTSLDHSKICTSFYRPSENFIFANFLIFFFCWGGGRGGGLGTSESNLISWNGVIASKIVNAHGVLHGVKPSEWWSFTIIWAPSSRPLLWWSWSSTLRPLLYTLSCSILQSDFTIQLCSIKL